MPASSSAEVTACSVILSTTLGILERCSRIQVFGGLGVVEPQNLTPFDMIRRSIRANSSFSNDSLADRCMRCSVAPASIGRNNLEL